MTQLFERIGCKVDLQTGAMSDSTGDYQKRFRDLDGLYADAFSAMQAEWDDRVVYDVSEFRPDERSSDLAFSVTRMRPGKVGEEYFVTRPADSGHDYDCIAKAGWRMRDAATVAAPYGHQEKEENA